MRNISRMLLYTLYLFEVVLQKFRDTSLHIEHFFAKNAPLYYAEELLLGATKFLWHQFQFEVSAKVCRVATQIYPFLGWVFLSFVGRRKVGSSQTTFFYDFSPIYICEWDGLKNFLFTTYSAERLHTVNELRNRPITFTTQY